jgi:hypothetical protein
MVSVMIGHPYWGHKPRKQKLKAEDSRVFRIHVYFAWVA